MSVETLHAWASSVLILVLQVHGGKLHDGRRFAMKIQYPGVARSIESDVDNLMRLISIANLLPKGLYVEQAAEVSSVAQHQICLFLLMSLCMHHSMCNDAAVKCKCKVFFMPAKGVCVLNMHQGLAQHYLLFQSQCQQRVMTFNEISSQHPCK